VEKKPTHNTEWDKADREYEAKAKADAARAAASSEKAAHPPADRVQSPSQDQSPAMERDHRQAAEERDPEVIQVKHANAPATDQVDWQWCRSNDAKVGPTLIFGERRMLSQLPAGTKVLTAEELAKLA